MTVLFFERIIIWACALWNSLLLLRSQMLVLFFLNLKVFYKLIFKNNYHFSQNILLWCLWMSFNFHLYCMVVYALYESVFGISNFREFRMNIYSDIIIILLHLYIPFSSINQIACMLNFSSVLLLSIMFFFIVLFFLFCVPIEILSTRKA